MSSSFPPGLLVLQGNRLEWLSQAVAEWLAAHPLEPLEPEVVLVQSNGMAEWFKMELARAHGVCASTTLELPARFLWRAYRAVLGRQAVPSMAPLDRQPLVWRLMARLPEIAAADLAAGAADDAAGGVFGPVRAFLGDGDAVRRWQLAQRLADLFDQYQVYRCDWLDDWAAGEDVLRSAASHIAATPQSVPLDQGWQPALWRALQRSLSPAERERTRTALHRRFLQALQGAPAGESRAFPDLPRRIVVFGSTHIPHSNLEALAALARHCQVLMAVPNPCRYHWADTLAGRDLLRLQRRRLPLRNGRELSTVPFDDMHAHGHPLLSAWGRQSRDFVRQLDAFDEQQTAAQGWAPPRVDLFEDPSDAPAGDRLLQRIQSAVLNLLPLSEHTGPPIDPSDRSVVFHIAHSPQREVEVLHDQLLALLAHPPTGAPLEPRDIVVMVPDIDTFAPAIRSVFGQHPRSDPRHIPWGISDQKTRGQHPLLVAVEFLLRIPQERVTLSQIGDLLEVPAIAQRFGISQEDLPLLVQWMEGAGVRWGLHAQHRAQLGLDAAGALNTWSFGLRRMLMGYACGELPMVASPAAVEPYAEVGGLGAGLAGSLAALLQVLDAWSSDALEAREPKGWAERLRTLLDAVCEPTDDKERAVVGALDDALAHWLYACDTAGFSQPIPLSVAREAWLNTLDEPDGAQRFKAGGVTFCTLLPLRAIPFEVVCLLGMNDADYPRRGQGHDFDLMALPLCARPGDRSRRDDDRQLMLDALLSARRVFSISWAGRSPLDNQEQPPSTLVGQLRDYLAQAWGADVVSQRTTEHPLQPFSRRYFEQPVTAEHKPFVTYATEWRAAHLPARTTAPKPAPDLAEAATEGKAAGLSTPLTVSDLAAFLANPVRAFFRHRLSVRFDDLPSVPPDDEPFAVESLARWRLIDEVLRHVRSAPQLPGVVERAIERLGRAGQLPLGPPGNTAADELLCTVTPMVQKWHQELGTYPCIGQRRQWRWSSPQQPQAILEDEWVDWRSSSDGAATAWVELQASAWVQGKGKKMKPRADRLLEAWLRCLMAAARGETVQGWLIGTDAAVWVRSPSTEGAEAVLTSLLEAHVQALQDAEPWPTAVNTGLAVLEGAKSVATVYEGSAQQRGGAEGREPCLARIFPSFAHLSTHPRHRWATERLYGQYRNWITSDCVEVHPYSVDSDEDGATTD